MSTGSDPTLTYLLSSTPYTLAYSLPLLLLSFVLTFSGTFLMLDRSRSFPPSADYTALPGAFEKNKRRKLVFYLEGGVGGLACGYTTGLHSATFLSLLIPNKTTSAPLSSKSFLVVWVLVCIFTTLLAGRYRYAALGMAGMSGGALASLAFLVIIHPSLPPRVILTAILAPLFTCLVLFFYFVPKFHSWLLRPTLRFCTSSNGAFGIVLAIALLSNPKVDEWANVWERLWLRDGNDWATGKEKGLSAAFCIFLVLGAASDYLLHRFLGECPDEKWDNYLANYMANLPNQADRAGIFEPPKPFWERYFPTNNKRDPILFPPEPDLKAHPESPLKFTDRSPSFPVSPPDGLLKKSRTKSHKYGFQPATTRKRKPIKFGGINELSSSDEEENEMKGSPIILPPLSYSSSTPTLVDEPPRAVKKKPTMTVEENGKPLTIDYDAELAKLKRTKGDTNADGVPDYSDHEEDLTSVNISQHRHANEHDDRWTPAFMKRHSSGLSHSAEHGTIAGGSPVIPLPGSVPVPATPSLIKALDRIAIAHRNALGDASTPPASASIANTDTTGQTGVVRTRAPVQGEEEEEEDTARAVEHARKERASRWEEFWREVRDKAHTK